MACTYNFPEVMLCFSNNDRSKCERLIFLVNWFIILFSYDGLYFYNQPNSTYGHYYTTLANIDAAPLAVGGYSPNINKAEILDISSNTWTEVDNYPHHDWYVFDVFQIKVWLRRISILFQYLLLCNSDNKSRSTLHWRCW